MGNRLRMNSFKPSRVAYRAALHQTTCEPPGQPHVAHLLPLWTLELWAIPYLTVYGYGIGMEQHTHFIHPDGTNRTCV